MSVFAGCIDARNMTIITEIDCPGCGEKDGVEIFTRDSLSVGESCCFRCGYSVPEGIHLEKYLESIGAAQ